MEDAPSQPAVFGAYNVIYCLWRSATRKQIISLSVEFGHLSSVVLSMTVIKPKMKIAFSQYVVWELIMCGRALKPVVLNNQQMKYVLCSTSSPCILMSVIGKKYNRETKECPLLRAI